jgi:hypothetical protein
MPSLSRCIALVFVLAAFSAAAYADLKLTTRNTMGGNSTEGTTFVKGTRQRTEMQFGAMQQVIITQCDKRQIVTVSDACRTYMVAPMDPDDDAGTSAPPPPSSSSGTTRKGGTLTINNNSTNTGETKQMFGYRARHIKTSMSMTSSPDACNPTNMKIESDGWYADFSGAGMSCASPSRPGAGNMGRIRPDCQDRIRYTGTGMRRLGYPMDVTTTMTDDRGNAYTSRTETIELSRETLDPALFDVPSGYRQVNDYQGLMCQAAMTGAPARSEPRLNQRRRGGRGPLCVAPIENRTTTSVEDEEWRDTLIAELQALRVESVKLDARHPFDLEDEARAKGCRVVLYSDITELKSPSSGRRLGRAVGAGNSANYQSGIHVELIPLDDFEPWLDKPVTGLGPTLDDAGENTLRLEAQEVATELSKPH